MKFAAVVLGILGGLLAAMLGIKWLGDAKDLQSTIEGLRAAGADLSQVDSIVRGGYALLLSLVLGVAGAVMTLKGKSKAGGLLMLAGALIPTAFAGGKALVGTCLLLLGGILALAVKPRSSFGA